MKKRTKIIIAVAAYVALVGVFFLIFNHFYCDIPYDYDCLNVTFEDKTAKYTAKDFKEYNVKDLVNIANGEDHLIYIDNPLRLKSNIDSLYKQLEKDSRIEEVQYSKIFYTDRYYEIIYPEKTLVLTITLTLLTGGLVVSIICINKRHKQ